MSAKRTRRKTKKTKSSDDGVCDVDTPSPAEPSGVVVTAAVVAAAKASPPLSPTGKKSGAKRKTPDSISSPAHASGDTQRAGDKTRSSEFDSPATREEGRARKRRGKEEVEEDESEDACPGGSSDAGLPISHLRGLFNFTAKFNSQPTGPTPRRSGLFGPTLGAHVFTYA